ncbi:MAG TPA: BON domain-containing protein, partial [Spirochaetales bacterium]|nr:BON domain-containing protein [Spirochaetales bacterium]
LYDLVINTGLLSVAAAAALIKDALHEIGKAPVEEELKLKDLCLAQEIITRILYTEKLSIRLLEVISTDGAVLLKGNAGTQAIIDSCKQMVEEMPGVKGVISELYFEPQYVGV